MSRPRTRWIAMAPLLALLAAESVMAAPTLERTLDNGLRVAVFADHRLPIVQIQVLVRAGNRYEEPLESGAARLSALMLTRGTTTRTASQFSEEVERLGGTVGGDAARDYATLSGGFRSADFSQGLELVGEALMNPIFDETELRNARRQLIGGLLQSRRRLEVLADEHVWATVMRDHPYAEPPDGTADGLAGITRARLIAFHRALYRPDGTLLAIAGDVDPERAMAAAQEVFGGWSGKARVTKDAPAPGALSGLGVLLVDVPGAAAAEIRLAVPTPARGAKEAHALTIANELLGGGMDSRLGRGSGKVLKRYSTLELERDGGVLVLGTSARNDSVGKAVAGLRAELQRFVSEPPTEAEVARSRRAMARAYTIRVETLGSRTAQWLTAAFLGLGDDYPDRYPERLEGVTAATIHDVASRVFTPDRAEIVVVGAASEIKAQLEPLGRVEVTSMDAPAVPTRLAPAMRLDQPNDAALAAGKPLVQAALAAHGGLARIKAIKDSRVDAEVTIYRGGESLVGKQVELRLEPGDVRLETTFPQLATVQSLRGDSAWTRVTATGVDSTYDEDQDGVAGMRHTFWSDVPHLLLAAADPRSRVAYRGEDQIGDATTQVVEVVNAAGDRWVLFLDEKSHQLVAVEENQGSPLRGPSLRRVFSASRVVQGVSWPHQEERLLNGERTLSLRLRSVQVNTGITAAAFRRPQAAVTGHRRR
jgi:zinc protease